MEAASLGDGVDVYVPKDAGTVASDTDNRSSQISKKKKKKRQPVNEHSGEPPADDSHASAFQPILESPPEQFPQDDPPFALDGYDVQDAPGGAEEHSESQRRRGRKKSKKAVPE